MHRANNWLSQCGQDVNMPNYTAQRGEDRMLQALFDVISTTNKWCVEFGATDGKHLSNTWFWINKRYWSSVQIEPARDRHLNLRTRRRDSFEALQSRYQGNDNVVCLNRWVGSRGVNRLDRILQPTDLPREFDLISIDVDGADYDIWQSFVEYVPRVVVIEHNKTIPVEVSFHSDRGSSLLALAELGKRKGYELAAANDLNGIFVRRELFAKLGIRDNSPQQLWQGHEQYRMYVIKKGNDEIVFRGSNKLRWVRGADGTLAGQLRDGKFIQVEPGVETVESEHLGHLRVYPSGVVRHWFYSLSRTR